ncbi:ABC transporter transmembrane region-domain-containing protein [Lentinula raphanica]|nr:ABC transporter transmembrane region-domain-containing protein [Lentinula raphanica]
MSFAGLGAMFYLSPTLTTLMLCVVPPISFGVVFYGRYLKRLSNRTQEAMGEMSKHATESLSALRTVQAYNAQSQEQQKFHKRVQHVLNLARKEAVASGIFHSFFLPTIPTFLQTKPRSLTHSLPPLYST